MPGKRRKGVAGYEHGADAHLRATSEALARVQDARRVLLVEGISDQIALETLAEIEGLAIAAEGTVVLPAGGAQAVGPHLRRLGPQGAGLIAGGLFDAPEARFIATALRLAGFATDDGVAGLERLSFFFCDRDLEDELLRALGAEAALALIAREGEAEALATLRAQAAWRDRPLVEQLRRFLGSGARRKGRYADLFVRAIPPGGHPRPLRRVLGLD